MASSVSTKTKDSWIRSFTVTDPTKHEKGFTVYKVTYRAFSLAKPDEIFETVVWKRYNDFKKLYKALHQLHYNLRRPEKFPIFAKAKFFGRFDDEVVEERRQSALNLLEFVAKINPLTRSHFFRSFFEGGEEVSIKESPPHHKPLLLPRVVAPGQANGESHQPAQPSAGQAPSTPSEGGEPDLPSEGPASSSLGGVWLHRQNEEDMADYGAADYEDDEDDDRTTFSEDSVPSTPLPQLKDMSFFDPLSETDSPAASEGARLPQSNSWLFQAMDMCAVLKEDTSRDSPDSSVAVSSTADLSTDSGITINFPKVPSETPVCEERGPGAVPASQDSGGSGCAGGLAGGQSVSPDPLAEESRNQRNTMARAYLHCIRAQQAAERDAMYTDGSMVDSRSPNAKPSRPDGSKPMGLTDVTVAGEDDYLYQAAYHISLALDNEANGSYQAAFDLYKSGVGVLLKGVIADDNKTRREAVRRKTAQYLMKAEDLYNKYLSADVANSKRWQSEQPSIDMDPRSAHLRGSMEELRNYKVLGLIDTVLLVLDTVTYQTHVIKVLQKCSIGTKRATCVPFNCRYVVRLVRFIETENAIFLVLEHASGGKLWSYASGFLNRGAELLPSQAPGAGSLERRGAGSCGSRRSRHSTASSREERRSDGLSQDQEESGDARLGPPSANRPERGSAGGPAKPTASQGPDRVHEDQESSYASLIIDYGKNSEDLSNGSTDAGQLSGTGSGLAGHRIGSEFAELDIPDMEANLNDLANQCSQYDTDAAGSGGGDDIAAEADRLAEIPAALTTSAPVNLFSIDSLESPGSDLHSAGSADKAVFGFDSCPPAIPEPTTATSGGDPTPPDANPPAPVSTWTDHTPEDVIADALKVLEEHEEEEDLGLDFVSGGRRPRPSFKSTPRAATRLDTLPDTSGFASAMSEDVTSSQPGTDLAEYFDTGSVAASGAPAEAEPRLPPPLRHSLSMYETGTYGGGSSPQVKQCLPPGLPEARAARSRSVEERGSDDVLSSLMRARVEDWGDFEASAQWEAGADGCSKTKSEPDVGKMLSEGALVAASRCDDGIRTLPAGLLERPGLSLPKQLGLTVDVVDPSGVARTEGSPRGRTPSPRPPVAGPQTLSPDNPETPSFSSCESTPKHATIYSPDHDSGAVMDSPNPDSPEAAEARGHSQTPEDADATPTHRSFPGASPGSAGVSEAAAKPRESALPSLAALFAQMDEQVANSGAKSSTLPEACIRRWAAEILLALADLHAAGIVCQDLRPDNVLLAEGGHVRLTHFSQWQYVERRVHAAARESMYTAPEVNGIFEVTPASDWWSFGMLLYELLTGMSLHSCHPSGISSHTQLTLPDHLSAEARSLLKQLLQVNPQERLGSQRAGGAEEIRLHPFFKDINWASLERTAFS